MYKVCRFVIVTQQILQFFGQTLPTKTNLEDTEDKSSTSYFRHNIFGPNTYAFGFEIKDKVSGNIQFRDERRYTNGTLQGSYGYVRSDGRMTVTHFFASKEQGYLSQTQTYGPGDEPKWHKNWSTNKTSALTENPIESLESGIVKGVEESLNLTSILLPVKAVKENHGVDLNPPELEKELVNPVLLNAINGNVPKRQNNSIAIEAVRTFIPAEFPIVPFKLPHEDVKINLNENLRAKPVSKETLTRSSQNMSPILANKSYPNNQFEQSQEMLPFAAEKTNGQRKTNLNNSTRLKSISVDKNSDWYEKVIKQTRQEYLATVR